MATRELTELDRRTCIRALKRAYVGRVAYVDGDRPVIVTVNFRLDDQDRIVIRSVDGAKLEAARAGQVMTLQIDGADDLSHTGWSVCASGPSEEVAVDDPSLFRLKLRSWSLPSAGGWIRVTPDVIEGRRLA